MPLGRSIGPQPDDEPGGAQHAGDHKGVAPSPGDGDPWNDEWGEDRADVGAGVEDPRRQCPLAPREPLRDGLDGGRKVSGLPQPQQEPHEAKSHCRTHQRVAHGGETPDANREGVPEPGSQAIDDRSRAQHADGVGTLECVHDVAVLELVPADEAAEVRRQHSQHPAIDVVQGGRREQQRADAPPVSTDHRPPMAYREEEGPSVAPPPQRAQNLPRNPNMSVRPGLYCVNVASENWKYVRSLASNRLVASKVS